MKLSESDYKAIDHNLDLIMKSGNNFIAIFDDKIAEKMILLGLADRVHEHMNQMGHKAPITFTSMGKMILSTGEGYKVYVDKEKKKIRNKILYNGFIAFCTFTTLALVSIQTYQGFHPSPPTQLQQKSISTQILNKDTIRMDKTPKDTNK